MSDELEQTFGWLQRILDRRAEDGDFYYRTEALFDFLPTMLLTYGVDAATLTPQLQVLIGSFAQRAGVQPGMDKAQTEAAIQGYLNDNPLDPELVFEFERGSREERVTRGNEDIALAFAKYLVNNGRDITLPSDLDAPAVASGPMARFLLGKS